MVSNWTWVHDKIDGKHWEDSLTMDVNGLNVDGKPVYVYYTSNCSYYSSDEGTAKYAGVFTPPCKITVSWDINSNKDDYQMFYVLFSDKQLNVSTVRTDVPLKHWYGFRDYTSYSGLNPDKGDRIYNPR